MDYRKYNCSDTAVAIACEIVVGNLEDNITELQQVRTTWISEFLTELKTRINDTISNNLGLDKKKTQRTATLAVKSILKPAHKDLSLFRTQVKVDFPEDAGEILKGLGFESSQSVSSQSQEKTVLHLHAFRQGMSDELKTSITSKGISVGLIDQIIGYSTTLTEAEAKQEGLKESTKLLTEGSIIAFNSMYDEIIGICKIASQFYSDNPVKKELFTFSQILSTLS